MAQGNVAGGEKNLFFFCPRGEKEGGRERGREREGKVRDKEFNSGW